MKRIVLIGGSAGSGKSTLAKQLSIYLQLPWISTDHVRRILQISGEEEELSLVWNSISIFLHGMDPWEGGIVDGTAILPELVARDTKDIEGLKVVFLIQTDEDIQRIVEERSKFPYIKTKTPEQQAEKRSSTSEMNARIKGSAHEFDYPCIKAHAETTFEDMVQAIK